ncbi:MAG: S26 family signal peptidase [Candidatus Nanopelagicales bacterium]
MHKLTWTEAAVIVLVAAVAGKLLEIQPWRIAFNTTPSEPYGFYAYTLHKGHLTQGELVSFTYIAPIWAASRYGASGSHFLKRIGAVEGDSLEIRGLSVFACKTGACRLLGKTLTHDSVGRLLPPPDPLLVGVVPKDKYYLQSTEVPNSYDSRYYGLIPVSRIIGPAYPLLTWH